jgi:hypothetical protein
MSNRPGAWQRRRPHKRPKVHHQACQATRQGFYTPLLTMEEQGVEEEEDSPHLVAARPTTQWRRQVRPTTQWGHLGHHLQHLAQAALV